MIKLLIFKIAFCIAALFTAYYSLIMLKLTDADYDVLYSLIIVILSMFYGFHFHSILWIIYSGFSICYIGLYFYKFKG